MKYLSEHLLQAILAVTLAAVLSATGRWVLGNLQEPVTHLGQPITENNFLLIAENLGCEDARSLGFDHQICTVEWLVQNRDRSARTLGGAFFLFVGEDRYPAASVRGNAFASTLFPNAEARGTTTFEIPIRLAPSLIAVDTDKNGRSALIEIFPRAGP